MRNEPRRVFRGLRFAMFAAVVTAGVGVQASTSFAASDPYSIVGFDASYPQGGVTSVPSGFGIIGVTHGRPFTTYSGLASLWTLTTKNNAFNGSLYFNTGYALAYAKSETSNCATDAIGQEPGSGHKLSALQQAWAIGCSEADYAVTNEPGTPTMWWADIETGNSWSHNTSLNDATITGMVYELRNVAPNIQVGVYSTSSMWNTIAGSSYVNPSIVANWVAGAPSCSGVSGFSLVGSATHAPTWLAQSGVTAVLGVSFDQDNAC